MSFPYNQLKWLAKNKPTKTIEMETVDYLKKFDAPNTIELRFYNCDYMIAFAEYYHKEKLNQLK